MCELFAVNAKDNFRINDYLKEFYSHSVYHPHGWGLGILDGNDVNIEKEPITAMRSEYLKHRLIPKIECKSALAHIRYATVGQLEYDNCHPYTKKDRFGRRWTLIHNGTVFHYPPLDPYVNIQKGSTDSERILMYIVDMMNMQEEPLDAEDRFKLIDEFMVDLTDGNNKINTIFTDGELLYVHTNMKGTLYMLQKSECVLFATSPISKEEWKPVPFTQLLAFHEGYLVFRGTNHHHEYFDTNENMKHLYQIFSDL